MGEGTNARIIVCPVSKWSHKTSSSCCAMDRTFRGPKRRQPFVFQSKPNNLNLNYPPRNTSLCVALLHKSSPIDDGPTSKQTIDPVAFKAPFCWTDPFPYAMITEFCVLEAIKIPGRPPPVRNAMGSCLGMEDNQSE